MTAIGVAWYRHEDYPQILKIMSDADLLPPTYNAWRTQANESEHMLEQKGYKVVRVYIEPDRFPTWCFKRGLPLDAKARAPLARRIQREQTEALEK
jgi:hypothetical protein